MLRDLKIDLLYQPLIDGPPPAHGNLHDNACKGDDVTMKHWRDIWLKNIKLCKERFGSFAEYSSGKLHAINQHKPAIVCGSGPSLKNSIAALKSNAEMDHPLLTVSCLHNFGYFEDNGFHADYYVSLDAGPIVLKDVSESRDKDPDYYWEKSKDKTLIACVMSDPELFEKWQGKIYLFGVIMPDINLHQELQAIETFKHYFSCGGNALGACLYAAKSLMGSSIIHFVGADFCFDYDDKFYSYKTSYDQVGTYIMAYDVYGIPRKTWGSYLGFKYWFDFIVCNVPGRYVNCSEGILGAYREGNIKQFEYKSLEDALLPYRAAEKVYLEKLDPQNRGRVLAKEEIRLKELFANPEYKMDIALI